MTVEFLQDGTVTAIALMAAAVVARRVIGFVQPSARAQSGCSSCAARRQPCATRLQASAPSSAAMPVRLVRRQDLAPHAAGARVSSALPAVRH
jgi:positive regulator of sigma E activity